MIVELPLDKTPFLFCLNFFIFCDILVLCSSFISLRTSFKLGVVVLDTTGFPSTTRILDALLDFVLRLIPSTLSTVYLIGLGCTSWDLDVFNLIFLEMLLDYLLL